MQILRKSCFAFALIAISALPSLADPTVSTPADGASVPTSFQLNAAADTCNGIPVISMGYSIDSLPNAAVVSGTALTTTVSATPGNHTLRVKSWGKQTVCVTDVSVTVSAAAASLVPTSAISSGSLNGSPLWQCTHDSATSGDSAGGTNYPFTLGGYDDAQQFQISSYTNHGGERCSIAFVNDDTSHNYIYDVWVQFPNPALVGNLELDMNQVTPDGNTQILAFQCSGYKGRWEYSYAANNIVHWQPSSVACNPQKWTANVWHHVQIYTSRDDSGNTTYHWVALDGVVSNLNITTYQALSLGWKEGVNVANFQLDPALATGDPVVVYSHDLTVYRW